VEVEMEVEGFWARSEVRAAVKLPQLIPSSSQSMKCAASHFLTSICFGIFTPTAQNFSHQPRFRSPAEPNNGGKRKSENPQKLNVDLSQLQAA